MNDKQIPQTSKCTSFLHAPLVRGLLIAWIGIGLFLTQVPNLRLQSYLLHDGREQAIPEGKRLEKLQSAMSSIQEAGYVTDATASEDASWKYYQAQFFLVPKRIHNTTEQSIIVLDFRTQAALIKWCEEHGVECYYQADEGLGLGKR